MSPEDEPYGWSPFDEGVDIPTLGFKLTTGQIFGTLPLSTSDSPSRWPLHPEIEETKPRCQDIWL